MKQLRRRSGDPERAAAVLRSGSAGRAGGAGPREPGAAAFRRDRAPAEPCSCCAPTWFRSRLRSLLQTVARAVLLSRRGTLVRAGQTAGGNRAGRRAAAAPLAGDTSARRRAAAARARIFQRPRRLRRRRPRIRDDSRRGTVDAGAMDQRDRQSLVRLPGLGRGRGLHLVDQQPAESDHAMVERSGQRPAGRGDLRSRRRHRRALGPDRAADSRGDRALRRFVTARATAVSSTPRTESRSSSSSTCRSTTRSRSRG